VNEDILIHEYLMTQKFIYFLKKYVEKPKMSKKYEKANKKKLGEILEIVYKELLKPLESIFKEENRIY
jgi:hypothetical protein